MTVDEIIEKYAFTRAEKEGIKKMISMMMVLKKYENLKEDGVRKCYKTNFLEIK